MRYQITALRLELGRMLRLPRTWAALLLVFVFAAAARYAASPTQESAVRVGVVLPEQGGELFWDGLEQREDLAVSFIRSDEETVHQMVAVSRWDCGLLLAEDFEERMEEGSYDKLITLVIGPGSAAYPLVRETVAAVIARQASPQIAGEYLISSGIMDKSGLSAAYPRLFQTLPESQQVSIELETLDGGPLPMQTLAERGTNQALRGVLALGLMVWMLLTAMDLGRWKESPAVRRMRPYQGGIALLVPRLLSAELLAFCGGTLGILVSTASPTAASVVSLIPYLAALGALALLLADTQHAWKNIATLLPLVVVAGFVLSPMLVDITLLYPKLAPLSRWFPVTLYLQSSHGEMAAAGKLLVIAGGIAAVLLWRQRGTH